MKVLVCGGRYYADAGKVDAVLKRHVPEVSVIIQGGANGADLMAKRWAEGVGIHCATVPAQWGLYGKSAGPRRNAAMLSLMPDLCIAFPGGRSTQSMIDLCKTSGVPVIEVVA